jgi:hypothetical protein
MGWAAIIAALIRVLGPVLADWLEGCTKERLENAAAKLPAADTFASEGEAAAAVFDRAIKDLPRWAKWRRKALARAKEVAVQGSAIRREPLTADEVAEGLALTAPARAE